MGPSGAGKSTLLNILTGFENKGMTGKVLMNGRDRMTCDDEFRRQACYITQDDSLCPLFTAGEVMAMAADLKLGASYSKKARRILVEDVMEALGLSACRNTLCERLSGGQKKRISIALELLDNPPAMFLDEPTTGLDSLATLQCLTLLKNLARGGRSIICTIHQPSAAAFELFDQVYVLAQGYCVYRGQSSGVIPFLDNLGFKCPQYHNPADYLLEVVNGEHGEVTNALVEAAVHPSWEYPPPLPILAEVQDEHRRSTPVRPSPPSEWVRFPILFSRFMLQLHRDWTVTYLKMLLHVGVAVTLGLIFNGVGQDGSKTITNFSFLFCCSQYLTYTTMTPATLKYPQEVAILKKEWFNNWYKLRTYYAASLAAHVPVHLTFCLIFCSIAYFMTSQIPDVWRFSMFYFICVLTTLAAEGAGLGLGSTFLKDTIKSLFVGAILLAYLLLFSGFLALLKDMHMSMRWLSTLSFVRFGTEGLALITYGYNRTRLPCPPPNVYCHLREPTMLLRELSLEDGSCWFDIGILFVFIAVLRIVTYYNLHRNIHRS
ncbi:ATP-binding cassette sub-family G member 1 isoform X2 [Anabrus simplex]